jgi:hypothetical protein
MIDEDLFCPQCGYNLRGLPEERCPECGTRFEPVGVRSLSRSEAVDSYQTSRRVLIFSVVASVFAVFHLAEETADVLIVTVAVVSMLVATWLCHRFRVESRIQVWPFAMEYLPAIVFLAVSYFLSAPTATLIGAGFTLTWAWSLCLFPWKRLPHTSDNFSKDLKRQLGRWSIAALIALLMATALTLLCLV